jgi:SAM-dependent MidA family methyltransferase
LGIKEALIQEIREKGPIPFSRFMELCLYHPQWGYYLQPKARQGKAGDYFTAPTLSPLFGKVLAKWVSKASEEIKGNLSLLELGSGEGYLAKDILSALKERDPFLFERIEYLSLEKNPHLIQRQKKLLREFEGKVKWPLWEEIKEIRGIVIGNEFFDAFPVERVKVRDGKLWEIRIDFSKDELRELLFPASKPVEEYFQYSGGIPPEGTFSEAHILGLKFFEELLQKLKEKFIVLIDYGYTTSELLSRLFPEGTLRAFKNHRVFNNLLSDPGERDLTSSLNFTVFIKKAEELGWKVLRFGELDKFLIDCGILEELEGDDKIKERLQAKILLLPQMMGKVFKVLILKKEVQNERARSFRS